MEELRVFIEALQASNLANPVLITQLVAFSGTLSVITEVLKKLPKVPVNSDNATVVILVLATVSVLALAYLDKGLTISNADAIVGVIVTTFGLGVGLYKLAKPALLWAKERLAKILSILGK